MGDGESRQRDLRRLHVRAEDQRAAGALERVGQRLGDAAVVIDEEDALPGFDHGFSFRR
jgi:hypothetical protein